MVKLYEGGVYILNSKEIIEEKDLECYDSNLICKEQFDDLVENINSFVGVVSENSNILKKAL